MGRQRHDLPCLVVDASIPTRVARGLRRRGYRVIVVGIDITPKLPDRLITKLAERNRCVIITKDKGFAGKLAVVVPQEWFIRYNTWEIVTKIVIRVATLSRTLNPSYKIVPEQ